MIISFNASRDGSTMNAKRILVASFQYVRKNGVINYYLRFINRKLFDFKASEEFFPGSSSLTDSTAMSAYPALCGTAAKNDLVLSKFRRARVMVEALDHVSIEQGKAYLSEIHKEVAWSQNYTKTLKIIDNIGKPRRYYFKSLGLISPTLLRYLKVYVDLRKYFGSLTGFTIAEIGVGFGGQGAVLSLLEKPNSYLYYDIPPVLDLVRKMNDKLELKGKFDFFNGRNPGHSTPDLVISNYAFSELNRELQDLYLRNVILNSPRGYITWNYLSADQLGGYSLNDLIQLIPNSRIVPEVPITHPKNAIIIFGADSEI